MRLTFKSKPLDNNKLFLEYKIQKTSTILLSLKLKGGMLKSFLSLGATGNPTRPDNTFITGSPTLKPLDEAGIERMQQQRLIAMQQNQEMTQENLVNRIPAMLQELQTLLTWKNGTELRLNNTEKIVQNLYDTTTNFQGEVNNSNQSTKDYLENLNGRIENLSNNFQHLGNIQNEIKDIKSDLDVLRTQAGNDLRTLGDAIENFKAEYNSYNTKNEEYVNNQLKEAESRMDVTN